jgi:3-phenylpropionate/trans-cinnamate dioxygenase ferredoxin component
MTEKRPYLRIINADAIAEGDIHRFEVEDHPRILTRVNGALHALDGICTHEDEELADGDIEDNTVWCPVHGSGFRVDTGAATNLPAVTPVSVYDVQIVNNMVYVSVDPDEPA